MRTKHTFSSTSKTSPVVPTDTLLKSRRCTEGVGVLESAEEEEAQEEDGEEEIEQAKGGEQDAEEFDGEVEQEDGGGEESSSETSVEEQMSAEVISLMISLRPRESTKTR